MTCVHYKRVFTIFRGHYNSESPLYSEKQAEEVKLPHRVGEQEEGCDGPKQLHCPYKEKLRVVGKDGFLWREMQALL